MLVTFHGKAGPDITMFGDIAIALLKMMGHSGTVPSAISADDIPAALSRLEQKLAVDDGKEKTHKQPASDDEGSEPRVALRTRAYPLIQLLSASAKKGCDVMWDEGHPLA